MTPHSNAPLCPRCRIALFAGRTASAVVHGCGRCGGVWVDHEASRLAIERRDSEVLSLAERASRHSNTPIDTRPTSLACPACSAPLVRPGPVTSSAVDVLEVVGDAVYVGGTLVDLGSMVFDVLGAIFD